MPCPRIIQMLCHWVHLGVSCRGNVPVNDPQVPKASTSFEEGAQALMDLHGNLGGVSTVFRDMGLGDGHSFQPLLAFCWAQWASRIGI